MNIKKLNQEFEVKPTKLVVMAIERNEHLVAANVRAYIKDITATLRLTYHRGNSDYYFAQIIIDGKVKAEALMTRRGRVVCSHKLIA